MRIVVLATALAWSVPALACPGSKTEVAATDAVDAAACARKAEYVGGNCSYSTNMMAQKVLEQGSEFTYVGSLTRSDNKLASHVAAPFTVNGLHVIANQVIDAVSDPNARLALAGKVLEVDGTKYLLLTKVEASNS